MSDIPLKEYVEALMAERDRRVEQRFSDQERAVNAALAAAEKAVNKAEVAAEKRFEATNEFRAQLSDQATTFMPRREAEQQIDQLSERVGELWSRADLTQGRSGGINAGWAYLAGAVGVAGGIIALVSGFR